MKIRRNKYKNTKATCESGHKHDSKMEANYCDVLLGELQRGEIEGYKIQPAYELQEKYRANGKGMRSVVYKADFLVRYKDHFEVVDVKGSEYMLTSTYKLKRKMFLYKNPGVIFVEVFGTKKVKKYWRGRD